MSADKHRSRDRRRSLIYRASHDWRGLPIGQTRFDHGGQLYAFRRNLKNRDVKRLLRDGVLMVQKRGRGRSVFGGYPIRRTFLVVRP